MVGRRFHHGLVWFAALCLLIQSVSVAGGVLCLGCDNWGGVAVVDAPCSSYKDKDCCPSSHDDDSDTNGGCDSGVYRSSDIQPEDCGCVDVSVPQIVLSSVPPIVKLNQPATMCVVSTVLSVVIAPAPISPSILLSDEGPPSVRQLAPIERATVLVI